MKAKKTVRATKTNIRQPMLEPHQIAQLWPLMTPEERAALKKDMVARVANGLDPLEHPILLYEGKILDGRHRKEVWDELAAEGACNGYFASHPIPTQPFDSNEQGTLAAWMRAKSLNMVQRQLSADQRTAVFFGAVKAFPQLKAVIDEIALENAERKKEGRPLAAGDQRGDTNKAIAKMVGVGATKVKEFKNVEKEAPDKLAAIAQGKTTAKKVLKEVKEEKRRKASPVATEPTKAPERKTGLLDCTVRLELRLAEDMTVEQVASRLRIGKAEFRGFHIWLKSGKALVPPPGAPLTHGCLAEVTGIRTADGPKQKL